VISRTQFGILERENAILLTRCSPRSPLAAASQNLMMV